jgi:shikimate kinase
MNNIYLVGFMGTGKTCTGKEVARIKKWQFADIDELIEFKEKRPISDIFAKEGEGYFRCLEKCVLKEVSVQEHFVVACGGGIVTNEENIRLMKQTGVLVCLQASPAVIIKRTAGTAHRPLLAVPDPKQRIEELLKSRAPLYAQADHVIDTSALSIEEAAQKIIALTPIKR